MHAFHSSFTPTMEPYHAYTICIGLGVGLGKIPYCPRLKYGDSIDGMYSMHVYVIISVNKIINFCVILKVPVQI